MYFSVGCTVILGRNGHISVLPDINVIVSLLTIILGEDCPTKPLLKGCDWTGSFLASRLLAVELGTGSQRLSSPGEASSRAVRIHRVKLKDRKPGPHISRCGRIETQFRENASDRILLLLLLQVIV